MGSQVLNKLKIVLVEKDISQIELAKLLGKTVTTVNRYCNNKAQPSLITLNKIAELLDVDLYKLIAKN